MSVVSSELQALADALAAAQAGGPRLAAPPSSSVPGFDLAAAYVVEAEIARRRRASGRTTVGYKVGYANKAMWRVFGLQTLVWAHMYDDTVREARGNAARLAVAGLHAPKIEPEIVLTMKAPVGDGASDAAAILAAVESVALGFEIIHSPYPDWTFQPADFVAAFGLHAALFVGEPRTVDAASIPALADALAKFRVTLSRDGEVVAEGAGKNALRSPALCVGELASALARAPGAEPLAAGDRVSSGTLTESQPLAAGETWTAVVDGIELPTLTLVAE